MLFHILLSVVRKRIMNMHVCQPHIIPPHKIIWLFLLYTKIIALYCHCRDTPTAVQRKDSTPTFHVMVSTGAYIGASVRHSIMVSENDNH